MTPVDFYASVGRISREQGWNLESVSGAALSFIAANQQRRTQFIRLLRKMQREENEQPLADEVLGN